MNPTAIDRTQNIDVSKFRDAKIYIAIFVVLVAIFNPVLRPAADVGITPYYLIFSIVFIWIMLESPRFRTNTAISLAVLCYGIFAGYFNDTPWQSMAFQSLKYWQLWTFLGFLSFIQSSFKNGSLVLLKISYFALYVSLALAISQEIIAFEIPTVVNEESYLWINTFFYTPNDLALFLGGMFCVLLISKKTFLEKFILSTLMLLLNVRNDAKAVIIACVIVYAIFYLLSIARAFKVKLVYAIPFGMCLIYPALYFGINSNIDLYETNFDFYSLFIDPIDRIIHFDPYNLGGSIYDRTDALIYNIEALYQNNFLGLGPGGSVYLLSLSNFELLTAKSLHNALAEFIVEFGVVGAAVCILGLALPAFKALRKSSPNRHDAMRVAFFVAMPLLSVSQSSGFISNYAFWLTAFLVWNGRFDDRYAPKIVNQHYRG